ncbi:MAG: heme exporter protein CcmB [Sphingomonadaceae bacterium]
MRFARLFALLFAREITRALARPAEALLPPLFFLLVAIVFAFALGPEPGLLARAALGILWVAVLLSALLPVAGLFQADAADGTLDQLAVRGIAAETLALARLAALWLLLLVPLLVALPAAAALLALPLAEVVGLVPRLLLGTLGLSALAVMAGALMIGARGGGGLVAILVVPVAIPLLVFGTGTDGLPLLAATTLLLVAIAPFAAGAAVRLSRG